MSEQQNPLAMVGVKTTPRDATHALSQVAKMGYPVVAPGGTTMCAAIPDGHAVQVTAISFTEEDTFKDKTSGQLCFKATALARLAKGLGLRWRPQEFRRLDDQKDSFYCNMLVVGEYRDYTGEWVTVAGTKLLDLRDGSAQLAGKSDARIRRERADIQPRCETMAKSRCIADACVSRTIEPRDLGRPIFMGKVFRTAPVDPQGAQDALYGREESTTPQTSAETAQPAQVDEIRDDEAPAGPCVPPIPAVYGEDAGKPITEASDATLKLLQDNAVAFLSSKAATENEAKAREVSDLVIAVDAEVDLRRGSGGAEGAF